MRSRLRLAFAFGLCLHALCSQSVAAESTFDGRWDVALICPDTKGENGYVKGYEYFFSVLVDQGTIKGQYGAKGHPSSVEYIGRVNSDGTFEIAATGVTGPSEYSFGRVAQGTRYSYTMEGRLTGSSVFIAAPPPTNDAHHR